MAEAALHVYITRLRDLVSGENIEGVDSDSDEITFRDLASKQHFLSVDLTVKV